MDFACLNVVLPCMLSYIKDLIGQKKKKKNPVGQVWITCPRTLVREDRMT